MIIECSTYEFILVRLLGLCLTYIFGYDRILAPIADESMLPSVSVCLSRELQTSPFDSLVIHFMEDLSHYLSWDCRIEQ